MSINSLKGVQVLLADGQYSNSEVLEALQDLDPALSHKLARNCLTHQLLRDALCSRMQQACHVLTTSRGWGEATAAMALLEYLLGLLAGEVKEKTAMHVLFASPLLQHLADCLRALTGLVCQVGATKPEVSGLADALLDAIQDICLWSYPVTTSASQAGRATHSGTARRSGAEPAGQALLAPLLDLITLLTKFPGAYALRRDAVGVLTELTIPKRNLALLSSPALAPAVGTLFTDVLAACGDHATQTDILQLLYYRCRSSPNLAATCLTHTETLAAFTQMLSKDPKEMDLQQELREVLQLYNGSRGLQASVMSLAAEAITTDCPALQPASLHMDWGSGHFSILMTTSTQGQGGGDHLQDQDPGETVHILDVDLSDIVRVTIQPSAAGGAALQTAQVELVPQQRRSGTQGGADGMVSPHRPCEVSITFRPALMSRFSTILQRQGCTVVQHSNGLFELSQPNHQPRPRMSKGAMPDSYRRAAGGPTTSNQTPASSIRIGQLVFRKSTAPGTTPATDADAPTAPTTAAAGREPPAAPPSRLGKAGAPVQAPVGVPVAGGPGAACGGPPLSKAFTRGAKGNTQRGKGPAILTGNSDIIEDADLGTLPPGTKTKTQRPRAPSQRHAAPTRSQQLPPAPTQQQGGQQLSQQQLSQQQLEQDYAELEGLLANSPEGGGVVLGQPEGGAEDAGRLPEGEELEGGSAKQQEEEEEKQQQQAAANSLRHSPSCGLNATPLSQNPQQDNQEEEFEWSQDSPGAGADSASPFPLAQQPPGSEVNLGGQGSLPLPELSDLLHSPDPGAGEDPLPTTAAQAAAPGGDAAAAGHPQAQPCGDADAGGPQGGSRGHGVVYSRGAGKAAQQQGKADVALLATTPAAAAKATPARGRLGGMQSSSAAKAKQVQPAAVAEEQEEPAGKAAQAAAAGGGGGGGGGGAGGGSGGKKGKQPRGKQQGKAAAAAGPRKPPTKRTAAAGGKGKARGAAAAAAAAAAAEDPMDCEHLPGHSADAAMEDAAAAAAGHGVGSTPAAAPAASKQAKGPSKHHRQQQQQQQAPEAGAPQGQQDLQQEEQEVAAPPKRSMRGAKTKALAALQAQLADTPPTQARGTTQPAKSAPAPGTPLSTAEEDMGGEDLLPPSSPSLSEPPPASAIKTKAVGGTSRAPPGKQRQANVKAQLLPLGRKPTSKPAPVDSTHPAARTAGGLPQLLQLGGAKPAPATVAATGGGEEEEEAGGMSPGGAPPSPTQSGVGNEVQAAKSGAAGAGGEMAAGDVLDSPLGMDPEPSMGLACHKHPQVSKTLLPPLGRSSRPPLPPASPAGATSPDTTAAPSPAPAAAAAKWQHRGRGTSSRLPALTPLVIGEPQEGAAAGSPSSDSPDGLLLLGTAGGGTVRGGGKPGTAAAAATGGLLTLTLGRQQAGKRGAAAAGGGQQGRGAKRARLQAGGGEEGGGGGGGGGDGDADMDLVLGMLTRTLKDDDEDEGSDGDNDAEVLKAALMRTISKRRAKSKQQQAALLKQVEEQVADKVAGLQAAAAAEANKLLAAARSQHSALAAALETKAGAVTALQARFTADLEAAWAEYRDTYAQLAALEQATSAAAAQQQERLRRKVAAAQQEAAALVEGAAAKLASMQRAAGKLPGLANMLKGWL